MRIVNLCVFAWGIDGVWCRPLLLECFCFGRNFYFEIYFRWLEFVLSAFVQFFFFCFIRIVLVCFFFLSTIPSRCCDSFSIYDNTVLSNNKIRCFCCCFFFVSVSCTNIRIHINQFCQNQIAFAQSSNHFRFFH